MKVSSTSTSPIDVNADFLVVVMTDGKSLSENISKLDDALNGTISTIISRKDFSAKPQEVISLFNATGVKATNVILVGAGDAGDCDLRCLRHSLLSALRQCCGQPNQSVAVVFDKAAVSDTTPELIGELYGDCAASAFVDADLYKAEKSRHAFSSATLCLDGVVPGVDEAIERGAAIGEACGLVKNLVNRTANDIYPETFAAEAVSAAKGLAIEVSVLEEEQLRSERMGALLAVAGGSAKAPRLVKMTYKGASDDAAHVALVGKGVTFDSGGYSIKPSDSMIAMKADMGGAATVLGTIVAAARLKLPVNITAYMGLVENMISGSAYRLGDVLTARNGTTIEVHNTDAEGRLVLADLLAFAVDEGAEQIIDLATLTGACVVALGEEITGVFPNNQKLADELTAAADSAGEFFWVMPMHKHFDPLLKSSVADCKNVGPRWGGAVTAAKFLQKFVGKTPWVHLDIAGPSWGDSSTAWQDTGATGSPLRSLVQWLRQRNTQ